MTLVNDLSSQGLAWGDTLIETLCDLTINAEERDFLEKMQTQALEKQDVVTLKKILSQQAQHFHMPPTNLSQLEEV